PRRIEATTPSQSVVGERKSIVRIEPEQEQITIRPVERPAIQPNGHETIPVSRPATIVQVESTPPAQAAERPENKPLLIKPRVSHSTPPARAEVIRETVTMKSHTILKGDTMWGLSRKYGVSTKSIMNANGISDASKIRLGAQLKIPAN
ncbi:LysM peptidoglycan-binding domain-containing protein, partial [bacterium]|nr:LysM peptidoglycan-binding domain-containing protein [bacterium]